MEHARKTKIEVRSLHQQLPQWVIMLPQSHDSSHSLDLLGNNGSARAVFRPTKNIDMSNLSFTSSEPKCSAINWKPWPGLCFHTLILDVCDMKILESHEIVGARTATEFRATLRWWRTTWSMLWSCTAFRLLRICLFYFPDFFVIIHGFPWFSCIFP